MVTKKNKNYIQLKIRTREINNYTLCNLCHSAILDNIKKCEYCNKNNYHEKCLNNWNNNNNGKCPECLIDKSLYLLIKNNDNDE